MIRFLLESTHVSCRDIKHVLRALRAVSHTAGYATAAVYQVNAPRNVAFLPQKSCCKDSSAETCANDHNAFHNSFSKYAYENFVAL
jgi:hypothetical protein